MTMPSQAIAADITERRRASRYSGNDLYMRLAYQAWIKPA